MYFLKFIPSFDFLIQMDKNKKDAFVDLILQVLDEPRLIHGAYGRFATVFAEYSEKQCSRSQIWQWIDRGIPANKIGLLESLSRLHAKNEKSVITAEKLRPDLFGKTKSKSAYLHGLVEINFAGITIKGDNLMFKLLLSAIASVKLTPVTINGVVKPVSNVTYRSNDESILAVDEFGNVVAVGYGKASIHITADVHLDEGVANFDETIEIEVTPEFTISLNPRLEFHSVPKIVNADASENSQHADSSDESNDSITGAEGSTETVSADSEAKPSPDVSPTSSDPETSPTPEPTPTESVA